MNDNGTDDELNHRQHRRRQADRDQDAQVAKLEQDLRSLVGNGVVRRIAAWIWPFLVVGAGAGYARWKGIPSPEWQARIEEHQREEQQQREQIRQELELVKAEVRWNASLSVEQRKELSEKIDRLEAKLDRWFEKAGR